MGDEESKVKRLDGEAFDQHVEETAKSAVADMVTDAVKEQVDVYFHEGDSETVKMIKDIARKELSTVVADQVVPAAEKSQKRLSGQTSAEQATMMARAQNPEMARRFNLPVAKSFQSHPVFHKATGGGTSPLGTGNFGAKCILYFMRQKANNKFFSWTDVRNDAHERGDKTFADIVEKNVQEGDFDEGGSLIPVEFAADIIGFLHGLSTVRDLGPVFMELAGEMRIPRMSSTVSASWRGEGGTVNASTPGTDEIRLTEKELTVRVIQSREFVRNAPNGAINMIRDDMQKEARQTEENTLIRSDGTSNEPTGIRSLMASGNAGVDRTQGGTESSVSEITGDLLGLQENVHGRGNNVVPLRPAYILEHRTVNGLRAQTDGNENPTVFAEMLSNGELFGVPVGVTTEIPENLDPDSSGDTDHTELYYVEMSEFIIADGLDVEIRETTEATVTDSNGNSRNLFDRNEMAIELNLTMDTAAKHGAFASYLKNVDWGADALP